MRVLQGHRPCGLGLFCWRMRMMGVHGAGALRHGAGAGFSHHRVMDPPTAQWVLLRIMVC